MSRKWERRLDRAILVAIALLLCTPVFRLPAGVEGARADHLHPLSNGNHIGSIHLNGPGNHEEYCVDTPYESLGPYPQGQQFAWNAIANTLYLDNPGGDWDELGEGRLYFVPWTWEWDCGWMRANRPNEYNATEIDYVVTWDGPPGSNGTFCEVGNYSSYGPSWDPHMRYSRMECPRGRFTNGPAAYHHAVNHETGHILGMADPPRGGGYCYVDSVMHSIYYGCANNFEWPTWRDFDSVSSLVYR